MPSKWFQLAFVRDCLIMEYPVQIVCAAHYAEAQRAAARALDLPATYDARYKVNAAVSTAPAPHLARAADGRLPPEAIEEYRRVLPVYENFHQKRQLARLVKLAKDKAQLPIAAGRGKHASPPPCSLARFFVVFCFFVFLFFFVLST